ncbi:putative cytochrome P450 YjiB [Dictyobacter vulcani]|uniref:Putative cytochrome P450 YjiB n=1 Tax=Dictyobacter vulcani TaxID=2607529 RepID=A0A5J4KXS6_9CHLR|nr:cytochrome P450 [Dictyobacter vulcani]GER91301.1 putative cytochrome P450 YjiB [Dictyobacter vulcani]
MMQNKTEQHSGTIDPVATQPAEEILKGFSWFAHMRANAPVIYDWQVNIWHVFRYDDVYQVITDHDTFSSENVPNFSENLFLRDTIVARNPPDHRRLRHLINQAFTKRAITHMEDSIRQLTQEMLTKLLSQGKMDVVSDLAMPLTTNMIAAMLEIPFEDWHLVARWVKGTDGDTPPQNPKEIASVHNRLGQEMYDYIADLLRERRRNPREGLITALSTASNEDGVLSDDELLKFCVLLLVAGQETMQNLIVNTLYCLMKFPESYAQLRQQPALMPGAIEEVLRYLPPFWVSVRRTLVDTIVGQQAIPANAIINAWNASANHDSQYFSEPERFDIQRRPNRHLSFGHGVHFCLGAPLARLEASIILPMLLNQLKNVQPDPAIPTQITDGPLHHIRSLPIMFEV